MKHYKGKIRGLDNWTLLKLVEPNCYRKRKKDIFYDPNRYNISILGRYKKMSTALVDKRNKIESLDDIKIPVHCHLMLLKKCVSVNDIRDNTPYTYRDSIGRNKQFYWNDEYKIYSVDNYGFEQKYTIMGVNGRYTCIEIMDKYKGMIYSYKNKIIFDNSIRTKGLDKLDGVNKYGGIVCPDVPAMEELLEVLLNDSKSKFVYMGELLSYSLKVEVIDCLCSLYGYKRNSITRNISY